MSSTKISAPRTLLTLPRAWIIAMPRLLASFELTPDDREALVVGGDAEPDSQPELRGCSARRVGRGCPFWIRLNGREAAPLEVVADGLDESLGVAAVARSGGRRDARDHRGQRRLGELRVQVAGPLRARVRGERPELGVGRGFVVLQQDLRIAP